jgi:hypothetical protein
MALVKSTNVSMSYATNRFNTLDENCFINKLPTSSQNTCSAAYSNRLVRAAYDGPIVQVRRGSDNALLDFYGDAYGLLTTRPFGSGQSLHTWLNGATGYVAKLYDQSGFEKHLSNPYIASNTSFPVSPLTGAVTNVSAAVGGGVYIVTSSGHDDFPPWRAFDNDLNSHSRSIENVYTVTTGVYTGTASTVTMSGTSYSGEWLQIQLPVGIKLSRFDLVPRSDYATTRSPRSFVLLGSTTGEAWNLVHEETNQNNWASSVTKQFTVTSNPGAYKYYRLVVRRVGNFDNDTTFGGGNQVSFSLSDFKLIGGNTDTQPTIGNNIFPPMPMTANTTSLTDPNVTYGSGTYIASASTEFAGIYAAWKAFDYDDIVANDSSWVSSETGGLIYNGTTGQYTGSVTTTVGATTYSGEWIQLQLPQRIQMTSFTICPRGTISHLRSPRSFVVLGSNNGTNWTLLHEQTNINDWSNGVVKTFSVTPNSTSFSYFRMVTRRVGNFDSSGGQTSVNILHWMLYGNNEACTDIVYNGSTTFLTTDFLGIRYYPPTAMTANSTAFTTAEYDNGNYIASASTEYGVGNEAWRAFDYQDSSTSFVWSSSAVWNTTTGNYSGSVTTTSLVGNVYRGEWLQLQLPNAIPITHFRITPRTEDANTSSRRSPRSFVILGSNNGSSWTLVHEETNLTWSDSPRTFFIRQATSSFSYYRMVIREIGNDRTTTSKGTADIAGWVLYTSDLPISQFDNNETFYSTFSMTSDDTTVAGLRYITSASSVLNNDNVNYGGWRAYDGDVGGTWWHSAGSWNDTTGQYTGSVVTRTTNGTSYTGEWLTIQLPFPIILSRYVLLGRDGAAHQRSPRNFVILGSNDGNNWNLVDQQTNINDWATGVSKNFYVRNNINQYTYAYYRIIVSRVGNSDSGTGQSTVQIGMWQMFGFRGAQKTTVFTDIKALSTATGILFTQEPGNLTNNGSFGLYTSNLTSFFGEINDSVLDYNIPYYRRKLIIDLDHTLATNNVVYCDNSTFFKNTSTNPIAHSIGLNSFDVGGRSKNNSTCFNGVINELIFFTESLRETDILTYYQTTNKRSITNYVHNPKRTVRGVLNIPNGQSLNNETFPPAAMNGTTNYLTSLIYGPGRYTASASTVLYSFFAFHAFDRISSNATYPVGYRTFWHSENTYNPANGMYAGGVSTAGHSGEWLQLDLAFPIVLKAFNLSARNDADIGIQCPRSFVMLGSNDATNWSLIHTETNINNWNTTIGTTEVKTFNVTNFMSFRYYRLVVKRIGNSDAPGGTSVIIGEMSLVGYSNTTMTHIPTGWRFAIDTQHLGNQSTGKPLTSWNTATAFNSPVYYSFGGNQDFPYVNFARASSQYLNAGSLTFNVNSGGGFTAVAFVKFVNIGTTAFAQRLFDFGNGQNNNNILAHINESTKLMAFYIFESNGNHSAVASSNNTVVEGEWAVWAFRYTTSSRLAEIYKNGVLMASTTFTATAANRTITNNYVGWSNWSGEGTTNMQLAGLYMYDRVLSLAEMAAISNHLVMPVRKSISTFQETSVVKANRAAIPFGRQLGEPSMFFDGSALNWVTIDDVPKAPFTFSFWFNASSEYTYQSIVGLNSYAKNVQGGIEIRHQNPSVAAELQVYVWNTTWTQLNFTAARDTWHHLTVAVNTSGAVNVWLNGGNKQTLNGISGAIFSRFYLGNNGNEGVDTGTGFKGYIQDFRVYDYVLRDDEVGNYRWGTNYPLLNTITSESGKYLVNRTNWYQKMTLTQVQGEYSAQQAASDPDVQVQLTNNTQDNNNLYSQNFRIQDYRSFTCRFEIYNDNAAADAIYFFVGSHILPLDNGTPYGGFLINFNVYTDGRYKGVLIFNNSDQIVAFHPWTYWVNSGTDGTTANGTHVWMPITITYTRGTENTWSICMGEREVLNFSDPNNDNWLTTSGDLWGIGARTGSGIMLSWIRGVELVYSEPRYQVPSYSSTFYVNNIVQNGLVAHFDPAIPACYPGSGATLTSLVGSVTGTLGGTYTYNSNGTIRLSNTSATSTSNVSYLQLTSITNMRTVSIWYYQHSAPTNRYLLDMRTGNAEGWIWNDGNQGAIWVGGILYKNGGSAQSINWNNIETIGQWQNITVIANTSVTDDMTLFARHTLVEGLDVTFGPIFVYNRAITEAENDSNYNAVLKTLPVFNQVPRNPLSLSAAVADNKLVSFPNGHLYNNNVVQSGLGAYFDPANSACYAGTFNGVSSTSLRSLVGNVTGTLGGTYSYSNGTIRLTNTSGTDTSNTSNLRLTSISNITTVSIWYYQHSAPGQRFLFDSRTSGGAGEYIYSLGPGTNWATGTLYKNGGSAQSITWGNIETIGVWQNVTLIANTPMTNPMTIFGAFVPGYSLDVTFGPILIYNRAITQAENLQNYNAIKDTIGSPYNASASSLLDLTTFNPGKLFDKSNSTSYVSQSVYNGVTGVYAGAASTTAGGVTYSGEWVQTTLNNTIRLRSYTITPRVHLAANFIENPQFSTTTTLAANFKSSYYWNSNSGWSSSTSSQIAAQYNADKALNKTNVDTNDCWHSAWNGQDISASNPQWIQIKYPEPVSIASYSITSRNDSSSTWFPAQWRLQGSNDGSTWVDLEANRSETTWSANTTKSYTPRFKTAYTYFRLLIEGSRASNSNSGSGHVAIGEWRLYTNLLTSLYRSPRSFVVLGSNDATTWNLIDERSSITDWLYGPKIFDVPRTVQPYNSYRLVAREVGNSTNSLFDWGTNTLDISNWELNAFSSTATTGTKYPIAPLNTEYPRATLAFRQSISVAEGNFSGTTYTFAGLGSPPDGAYNFWFIRNDGNLAWKLAGTLVISNGTFGSVVTTVSDGAIIFMSASGTNFTINPQSGIYPDTYTMHMAPQTSLSISRSTYGNGLYTVSASSFYTDRGYRESPWQVFDNFGSGYSGGWTISSQSYPSGTYSGALSTTVQGTAYAGEWIQITLPSAIKLSRYDIRPHEGDTVRSPRDFYILGSNDSSTWTLLDTRTNITDWTSKRSFSGTNQAEAFNTFRLVVNKTNGSGYLSIWEMKLFAVPEVPGNGLGSGAHTITSSSEFNTLSSGQNYPMNAFDDPSNITYDTTRTFFCSAVAYNSTTGAYTGSTSTLISGSAYAGEWLQIQLPTPIALTSYALTIRSDAPTSQGPNTWRIAGSNDGTTWSLVDEETNVNTWSATNLTQTFTTSSAQRFSYFRIICNVTGHTPLSNRVAFVLVDWSLYDTSVSMRSIAGKTTRGFVDGLTWKFANGYHNDSATYFETTPYTQIGRSSDFTNLSTATNGRFTSGQGIDSYSIEFTGYFRAPETGTYTFFANSDNKIYVWIGTSALSGYTTGNALFNDTWESGSPSPVLTTFATISLIAGTYYPIKLLWGEDGGGQHLFFGFTTPSGVTVTDGSGYFFSSVGTNAAYPAESAKIIKALNGTNTDGVYYINCNGVSEPTYCLMNDKYDGGGWMMLMKATRSNTFVYGANYWTTANTLNATDVTRTDGDAKYNAFNYKPIKDILAIWPDISPSVYTNNFGNQGGSFFVEDGWVWELTNWNGASAATALAGFQTSRTVNPQAPAEFNGFGPMWSTQSPTAHHVIGGATHLSHAGGGMARWGFVFSDTGDYSGQGSDCFCGIGLGTVQISAGDYNNGPGSWVINYGLNRTARVEMFGR